MLGVCGMYVRCIRDSHERCCACTRVRKCDKPMGGGDVMGLNDTDLQAFFVITRERRTGVNDVVLERRCRCTLTLCLCVRACICMYACTYMYACVYCRSNCVRGHCTKGTDIER